MRFNPVILLGLMIASLAPAQEPDTKNAVTWYSRAYERSKAIQVSDAEWEAWYQFEVDPFRTPPDHARQIMARFQPALALLERGLVQESYVPSRDWTESLKDSHSHLVQARNLARLLRYDFEVRLAENDVDTATQRVTAGYRLAQQIGGGDGPIIDGCVGIAIFAFTDRSTADLMDRGVLGPEQAAAILEATSSLDPIDPFKMRQAARNDQKNAIDRMKQRYGSDDGTAHLMEDLGYSSSNDLLAQIQLAALSPDAIQGSIQDCGKMLDRMAVAFDMPDVEQGQQEIDALNEEVKRGDFGPIAQHILGSGQGVFVAMRLTEKQLRERRAILQNIVDKKIDPMSVANAAVWYMRAIAELEKTDAARLDRIRAYAAQTQKPADDQLADDLDDPAIRRVIELLTEASHIQRCDFTFSGGGSFHGTFENFEAGMRDAARVLMADSVRSLHRLREGDDALAAEHLAVAFRMSAHLAVHKAVSTALTAHVIFKSADAVVSAAVEDHVLSDSQLAGLIEPVKALQQPDPFGYAAGVGRLRQDTAWLLTWRVYQSANEPPDSVREFVSRIEDDRLLWLAIIGRQAFRDPREDDESILTALRPLDDVISLEAVAKTFAQGETVRSLLLQHDAKSVIEAEWPTIAPVKARMQEAAEDVKRALRRLGLLESESPAASIPNQ